ncbi:unnamed protein product [Nesidiocoris tenuis]|uniref:Uncharacterized protein n=1 Tax=Nesidiocoris tenuis TaxID=355587 RepID=A0A6H5GEF4_9HEMI|nr:unnamed protein product [Nesidiocoris tenuis]
MRNFLDFRGSPKSIASDSTEITAENGCFVDPTRKLSFIPVPVQLTDPDPISCHTLRYTPIHRPNREVTIRSAHLYHYHPSLGLLSLELHYEVERSIGYGRGICVGLRLQKHDRLIAFQYWRVIPILRQNRLPCKAEILACLLLQKCSSIFDERGRRGPKLWRNQETSHTSHGFRMVAINNNHAAK